MFRHVPRLGTRTRRAPPPSRTADTATIAATIPAILPFSLPRLPPGMVVHHGTVAVGDEPFVHLSGVDAGISLGVRPLHLSYVDGATFGLGLLLLLLLGRRFRGGGEGVLFLHGVCVSLTVVALGSSLLLGGVAAGVVGGVGIAPVIGKRGQRERIPLQCHIDLFYTRIPTQREDARRTLTRGVTNLEEVVAPRGSASIARIEMVLVARTSR
mmetsp:Transcript_40531/g.69148  ORF Transcript_40531/g.69148 Transcript_40531/m.69148 type:complete len:212 (+) Transcript_40531:297-932(+)